MGEIGHMAAGERLLIVNSLDFGARGSTVFVNRVRRRFCDLATTHQYRWPDAGAFIGSTLESVIATSPLDLL
jgi:hypothetical protein